MHYFCAWYQRGSVCNNGKLGHLSWQCMQPVPLIITPDPPTKSRKWRCPLDKTCSGRASSFKAKSSLSKFYFDWLFHLLHKNYSGDFSLPFIAMGFHMYSFWQCGNKTAGSVGREAQTVSHHLLDIQPHRTESEGVRLHQLRHMTQVKWQT